MLQKRQIGGSICTAREMSPRSDGIGYKGLQHCYTSRCNSDPVKSDDHRKTFLGQSPLKTEVGCTDLLYSSREIKHQNRFSLAPGLQET